MREVRVIDTTLRDAHQCLWATRMTTAMMLPVAERMDRVGFESIDLAGAIQFDVAVRYLKENPWERVRLMRERIRETPLRALIRSKNIVSFDLVPDDIVHLWVERLFANGFRVIGAFDGLNDVENVLASVRVAKQLGATTFAALAFSESPVHTDDLYVGMASRLVASGVVDTVMLKDAGGLLTPDRIRALVPAVKAVLGSTPLELHSHCLTGLAPLVYLEGVELGVDHVHSSIAPLANGAAQPATQTIARNLRSMGYEVDVRDDLIAEVSEHFRHVAASEGKPVGVPAEYDRFHFEHQIPGGMLSNLRFQLEHAGIPEQFDAVLDEVVCVRRELAWPIMITPFAQLVATQAVLNVIHGERYRVIPDEVKKYALGHYGQLLAPVDPDVLDRVVENGAKTIPLAPTPLEGAVARLRHEYPEASDDERLLYFMFAPHFVDEMLAAGPVQTEWPDTGRSIMRLLEEVVRRPAVRQLDLKKGPLELRISTNATAEG